MPIPLHPLIRPETLNDAPAIHHVNRAAFARDEEANLVDALRADGENVLSLIAEIDGQVVGHILFCRVQITTPAGALPAVSLSPMAVLPEFQKGGIGSQLIAEGLKRLPAQGEKIVTVLGHPEFYPRFGFRPAHELGIQCPYEVPPEAWMLMELAPGALGGQSGMVVYPRAFENV